MAEMAGLAWWFVSFSGDEEWHGGIYVQGTEAGPALRRARQMAGVHELEALVLGPLMFDEMDLVSDHQRNRLLSREELGDNVISARLTTIDERED